MLSVNAVAGSGVLFVGLKLCYSQLGDRAVLLSERKWQNHCALAQPVGLEAIPFAFHDWQLHAGIVEHMVRYMHIPAYGGVIVLPDCSHSTHGAYLTA